MSSTINFKVKSPKSLSNKKTNSIKTLSRNKEKLNKEILHSSRAMEAKEDFMFFESQDITNDMNVIQVAVSHEESQNIDTNNTFLNYDQKSKSNSIPLHDT